MENQPAKSVEPDQLRSAMRRFASGVTVVTSMGKDGPSGITVSAFYSVSLNPPVIVISVNAESSLLNAIRGSGRFAVHILADEHAGLSEQFADSTSWERKVAGFEWHVNKEGTPVIDAVPTVLTAFVERTVPVGTHEVVFGNVTEIALKSETPKTPLLYYDRNYRTLDPMADAAEDRRSD